MHTSADSHAQGQLDMQLQKYTKSSQKHVALNKGHGWPLLWGDVQQHTLTAVVVRIDSLFWADSTLMRRRMSICMVIPWSVVYRVISSAILSAWLYTSAMLSRPVLTSGSVQRPALPGTSAHVLGSDTADAGMTSTHDARWK